MYWEDVIKTPDYQKLSDGEKREWRKEYFDDIIKPQIKAEEYDSMWKDFSADADQMEGIKQQPEVKPKMTLEEFNASADREIAELEKIVKPKPDIIDRAKALFNPELDETMEDVKNRTRLAELKRMKELNNPESTLGEYNSSFAKGIMSGVIPKAIKAYAMDGDTRNDILYKPDSAGQNIVQGLGNIASDLPLYAAGSGITTGGMIAKSAGSFALPKALDRMLDIRNEKGEVELSDVPEVMTEGGKGAIEGALFGAAGALGKTAAGFVPKYKGAVEQIVSTPLEVAIMGGSVKAQDGELNAETWGELGGTALAMKLLHANPYALRSLKKQSEVSGIPVEKLAENMRLDPKQAKILKDAEAWNKAAEESALRTEAQIKNEYKTRVQDEVIDKQIRANYKDGKPIEEIVKLEQIPTEYLPHIADMVDGKAVVKPEILQKLDNIINKKDPFAAQKYEDVLPGPMRDMALNERQQVVDQVELAKMKQGIAQDNLTAWQEQAPGKREQIINDEISKLTGDYKRYANQPVIREKMDAVIEHTLSITTPEERFGIAADPSSIRTFIDSKESGYSELKPQYQKAVEKEIVAQCIKEANYIPQHVIESAVKTADNKLKYEGKSYIEDAKKYDDAVKTLESHPEYQAYLKDLRGKPDIQVKQELEGKLDTIKLSAEEQLQANLVNFQKVMGVSAEYKSIDPKEYGSHYNSLVEFQKKPVEDIRKTLESANYLDMHVNSKVGLANKSRVIQQRLGEKVHRTFADPIREATWTFTKELGKVKEQKHELLKGLGKDAKTEIVDYMYSRQKDASPALARMGIKPKKWEELSAHQQAAVNELDRKFAELFDRINTARQMVGLEPLNKVNDYFTLIRKISFLEKLGYNPHNVPRDVFDNIKIEDVKTKALSFAFGKSRVRNERTLERDLDSALDKYYYSALRTIHLTPIIGKLREALQSEKMMITNPNAHQYLDMTLDFISGKRISEAKEITNYWANVLHRNLSAAVLAGNIHTVIVQPSSALIAMHAVGPRFMAQGLKDFGNEAMRKFAMNESKVLLTRVFDASIEEVKKGVTGKIAAAQAKGIEYGMLPTKYTDKFAAEVTWLGGYRYAKDALELNHKGCVAYADDLVIGTQGSAERIDLAPIQHTPLGKLFTTFQTFGINQFNYLKDEVIGHGKVNKLVAENVPGKQADTQFLSDKYIKKPLGKDKYGNQFYNIYEPRRQKDPISAAKDMAKYAVILGTISTIYELLDGVTPEYVSMGSPNAAPVSAFYEVATGQKWVDALYGQNPSTKEVNLIDGLVAAMKETATLIPVAGGSAKFGGSNMFGAMGALISDTGDLISGKPGAKNWEILLAKWAGVPGATQVHRILRELQKERIAEHKKSKDPLYEVKKQMQQSNPYRKQTQRYKDPGLVEGLFQ